MIIKREAHNFHTLLFSHLLRSSLFDTKFKKEQVTQLPYIAVPLLDKEKSVDWETITHACNFPKVTALDFINMKYSLDNVALMHEVEYQRK